MKKSIREFVPTSIALILILSIIVVVFSIMNNNKPPANSIPVLPVEQTKQPENVIIPDDTNNNSPIIEPYHTTYPKNPLASQVFLYEQNISGYGNTEIMQIHQTTLGLYAITVTNTLFGDVAVERKSVVVSRISQVGVIEKVFILPSRLALSYISSEINEQGLNILCKTEQNMLLYTIDYQLNQSQTLTLPQAEKGRLFQGSNGSLILAEGSQNTVYIYNGEELATAFLPYGDIIEIYDFYFYLMIFINTDTGYSVIKLSPALKIIQTTYIENSTILAIAPFTENSEQMFFIAEKNSMGTKLWKYNSQLSKSGAISTDLANSQDLMLLPQNDKIIAIYTGEFHGLYIFNSQLECTLINNASLQNIQTVYDYHFHANGFYLLCQCLGELKIVDCGYNNNYTILNVDQITQKAFFALNINSTLTVLYEKIDENENTYINVICLTSQG